MRFTSSVRKQVKCKHCSNECCQKCFVTYMLTDTAEQVCMHCSQEITMDEINALHLSKSFYSKYEIKLTRNYIAKNELSKVKKSVFEHDINLQIKKQTMILKEENNLRTAVSSARFDRATRELHRLQSLKMDTMEKVCPFANCAGFVISNICSHCNKNVCGECNGEKLDGHVCSPEGIETVKMVYMQTRKCPKCEHRIHKIDGCNDMFCTICHTAFSWRTGEKTSNYHNPHYFEMLRQQSPNGEISREAGLRQPSAVELATARFIRDTRVWRPIRSMFKHNFLYDFIDAIENEATVLTTKRNACSLKRNTLRIQFGKDKITMDVWAKRLSPILVEENSAVDRQSVVRNKLDKLAIIFTTTVESKVLDEAIDYFAIEFTKLVTE